LLLLSWWLLAAVAGVLRLRLLLLLVAAAAAALLLLLLLVLVLLVVVEAVMLLVVASWSKGLALGTGTAIWRRGRHTKQPLATHRRSAPRRCGPLFPCHRPFMAGVGRMQ
jgi:hypothetical protein